MFEDSFPIMPETCAIFARECFHFYNSDHSYFLARSTYIVHANVTSLEGKRGKRNKQTIIIIETNKRSILPAMIHERLVISHPQKSHQIRIHRTSGKINPCILFSGYHANKGKKTKQASHFIIGPSMPETVRTNFQRTS